MRGFFALDEGEKVTMTKDSRENPSYVLCQ